MAARPSEDTLRRYLLGLLPEAEAEAVEDAYFAHPEVLETMRGIEDDLLDDHAAGRLGGEEARAFERAIRASPARRPRLAVAGALRGARSGAPRRVARARRPGWAVLLAAAAGLLLALLVLRPRPAPAPEMADLPAVGASSSPARPHVAPETAPPPSSPSAPDLTPTPDPSAPQAPATEAVLALAPVLLRGQGGAVERALPPGTRTVVLELEGDRTLVPAPAPLLEAVVKTVEGEVVWRGPARRPPGTVRPSLLASARVPASRLPPGDYILTLSLPGPDDATVHTYYFRVGR